jgi:hypothetical protein
MLGLVPDSDYHFVLPHLFDDSKYFRYYRTRSERGDWIIMDNSSHELDEKEAAKLDLMKSARLIQADELVIPEVLFQYEKTKKLQEEFISSQRSSKRSTRWLGVVQGQDWIRVKEHYKWLSHSTLIDTIGIAYGYPFDAWDGENDDMMNMGWNRFSIIWRLVEDQVWNSSIPHHLFGLYNPAELALYKKFLPKIGNIRGNDSSCAFWSGRYGIKWDKDWGIIRKIKEPVDFNYEYFYVGQFSTFGHNQRLMGVYVNGEGADNLAVLFQMSLRKRGEKVERHTKIIYPPNEATDALSTLDGRAYTHGKVPGSERP